MDISNKNNNQFNLKEWLQENIATIIVGLIVLYFGHTTTSRIDNLDIRMYELTKTVAELDKSFAIHLNDHKHLDSNR